MLSDATTSSAFLRRRLVVTALLVLLTIAATVAVSTRLRLDPNVSSLLPERGEAAALRRYLSGFGGSDLAMVLISAKPLGRDAAAPAAAAPEGPNAIDPGAADPAVERVRSAALSLAAALEALSSVRAASPGLQVKGQLDPLLLWRHADSRARARLADALTPEGMRRRLRGSRSLLLAPGAGEAAARIARDPLRLQQLLRDADQVGSGFQTQPDGSFATDDGLARLVLVFPEGQALRGEDAKRFVREAEAVIAQHRRDFPEVAFGMTGGHAIAAATEHMLVDDMEISGTLSMGLAALAFMLTFRRLRALLAVFPPLLLGTLWTAGIATMLPTGLSAIAVAFMSVVIGVGVDTGVHVYAALLEARHAGLAPADAARVARQKTQRPVLVAALTAGAAFASLALSEIAALRQLGILCAGGEILTAVAIVVVTPELGARLEKGEPPVYKPPWWTHWMGQLTATRGRAAACLLLAAVPVVALAAGYWPGISSALVSVRPEGIEPLNVQQQIYDTFGGRRGQWVVLVSDETQLAARARADRIAEALAPLVDDVESVDALTAIAPAPETQRRRLAERDALDLPAKAQQLEAALTEAGFAPERFDKLLKRMRTPPGELVTLEQLQKGSSSVMLSRYLGRDLRADAPADKELVVIYVMPREEVAPAGATPAELEALKQANRAHAKRIDDTVRAIDAKAVITGYGRMERSLRDSLKSDLPRIGSVAGVLVLLALALALRRPRDILLAVLVVVLEMAMVLYLIRVLNVPLHAYDALVLPVLLGITVDEGMFLLFRAREAEAAGGDVNEVVTTTLQHEGPPVATTALTTAAGFGALALCDFDGLRHLGIVGAIGSLTGLLIALVVVPAGLRLSTR